MFKFWKTTKNAIAIKEITEKIEALRSDMNTMREMNKSFQRSINQLECDHPDDEKKFISNDGIFIGLCSYFSYGYLKCNKCGKKLKYFSTEDDYKKAKIKHLKKRLRS